MGHSGCLKHLSQKDKDEILFEIRFFFSQKAFIDGLGLYERFESLLQTKGSLTNEERRSYKNSRRKGK